MPDIFVSRRERLGESFGPQEQPFNDKKEIKEIKQKRHHIHPDYDKKIFSSLRYYPHNTRFINKDPDEEVVLIVRKHPISNLGWLVPFALMLFAPITLKIFPIISFLPPNFQLVSIMIWYMVAVIVSLEGFLTWFFNVHIVTSDRLVDVNFTNLIYKEITEVDLQQIQDVKSTVGSVIRTLFRFGNVSIQTAAENQGIIFEGVPNPDYIVKVIRELREAGEG